MRIRVLGELEFDEQPWPSQPMLQKLLAALVLNAGRRVSQELLIEYLWPGVPPQSARSTLHARKRNLVTAGLPVKSDGQSYYVDVEPQEVDVAIFIAAADELRATHAGLSSEEAYEKANSGLLLWRGRPAVEFDEGSPGHRAVQRIMESYRYLQQRRAQSLIEMEQFSDASLFLTSLIQDYPDAEDASALLMRSLYGEGRQTDALHEFERCSQALDEIGALPGDGLTRLRDQVLQRQSDSVLLSRRRSHAQADPDDHGCAFLVPLGEAWGDARVAALAETLAGVDGLFSRHRRLADKIAVSDIRATKSDCVFLLVDESSSWRVIEEVIDLRAEGHRVIVIALSAEDEESTRVVRSVPSIRLAASGLEAGLRNLVDDIVKTYGAGIPTEVAPAAGFWPFDSGDTVYLVCAELPQEHRLPYAEARTPDHLRLARFADIDALFLANSGLSRLVPGISLQPTVTAELHPGHLGEHLVMIGGPAWNTLTAQYSHRLGLPIQHEDGGAGKPDPYRLVGTDTIWVPDFAPAGDVTQDFGLIVRAPNLVNPRRTTFIFSGILTHGVEGAVKGLVDPGCADENVDWITARFGREEPFALLFRVSVVNNYNVPPRFSAPSTVVAEATWDKEGERFVLVD